MSCVRRLWKRRNNLSARLTRTYALLFAATTLVLSLCVFVTSVHFLLNRRRTELAGSLRNISEIFLEEVADGHDPTDPNVLWELNTDEDVVLLFLASDGTVASRAGYFEVDVAGIPDCVGKTVFHKEDDGSALLARSMPVLINGEAAGTLMAVKRFDREYTFLAMLARLLLILNVCGALAALGVGKIASRKMLAPLSAIIRRARSIDGGALRTRVELPPEDDELRLLAQTLNDMLDRMEDAFARQGQFTQDASHELRTPLAVLQGNAELLSRWGREDPAVLEKCVAAICRQTEYMTRLTENLLFLTRGDRGAQAMTRESLDAARFLNDLLAEKREIDPAHPYQMQVEPGLRVYADEALLRQLFFILLDNAARYTPAGGSIFVCAASDGDGACLSVRDEGCGVPADQLDKIFERFYRVDKARDRSTGGTGLGLSIAKTIVRMHGGTIRAQQPDGPGLLVTVHLPAEPPREDA